MVINKSVPAESKNHMKKGFTLIEMLLVVALLGVLAIGLGSAVQESVKGYDMVWTRRQLVAQARAGMDRMIREIQLIPASSSVINVSSSDQFIFRYPSSTQIRFSLSGTNLRRNNYALIEHVQNLTFTYYDENGNTTNTAGNVRSVAVQFTLDPATVIPDYTLRTRTFLRNAGNYYSGYDIQ